MSLDRPGFNDVRIVGFEKVCDGKNNLNQVCPYRQFLVNRIETRSCETSSGNSRTDYKVYKNNKVVEKYCEGDCKSPVLKSMRPVCTEAVIVKDSYDKWKEAERQHHNEYYTINSPPDNAEGSLNRD